MYCSIKGPVADNSPHQNLLKDAKINISHFSDSLAADPVLEAAVPPAESRAACLLVSEVGPDLSHLTESQADSPLFAGERQ